MLPVSISVSIFSAQRLADAGQLGQPPSFASCSIETGLSRDGAGRLPVGEHPEAIRAVELVEDPELAERGGYLGVSHRA